MAVTIAALAERAPEARIALTPPVISALARAGAAVIIEANAGAAAGFVDEDYVAAGASIATRANAIAAADVVACVRRPDAATLAALRAGQVVLGLLDVWDNPAELTAVADRGVSVLSFDSLPRQISRAQTMDVLSSQASIAGYRAAIVAAETYGRYFPMMVTAAGTAKPATVLVLGAGVAGLQAIATARRLGARVTGYDVRPDAREEVTSLGAAFLATAVDAVGEGGYARELTEHEAAQQRAELAAAIASFDVIIATAKVPGRTPPLLVTADTVAAMRRGSVIVDLAASSLGGNVAGSVPDAVTTTDAGVTIIGAGELAAQMAPAASDAFARNVTAVVASLIVDGALVVDPTDDVIGSMLTTAPAKEESRS